MLLRSQACQLGLQIFELELVLCEVFLLGFDQRRQLFFVGSINIQQIAGSPGIEFCLLDGSVTDALGFRKALLSFARSLGFKFGGFFGQLIDLRLAGSFFPEQDSG